MLHLVEDLSGVLFGVHANLKPGGLLVGKTWCFAAMGLKPRGLFLVLRTVGLFPTANARPGRRIVDERVFGANPRGPIPEARLVQALKSEAALSEVGLRASVRRRAT